MREVRRIDGTKIAHFQLINNNFKLNSLSIFNVPNAKTTSLSGSRSQDKTKQSNDSRNHFKSKHKTVDLLSKEEIKQPSHRNKNNRKGVKMRTR